MDYFVYFKKLYPAEQKAVDIHIYKIEDEEIVETIIAQEAYFLDNRWYASDAKIISKPKELEESSKLTIKMLSQLQLLRVFT